MNVNRSTGRHAQAMVVITALLLLAACVLSARAEAAEKAIWGPTTLPDGRPALRIYEELGADVWQSSLNWSTIAQSRPASPRDSADPPYRWPQDLAQAVVQANARAIGVALLVTGSPGWANGGRPPVWAPQDPRDFADFMVAAARRYPSVRRWMIWGEPNRDDRFQPNRENDAIGPRAYAPLLDAAYGALKATNPRNVVIGGMTWTGGTVKPPDFVRFMRLPSGRPPRLDWFGHNPFPFRFPDLGAGPIAEGFRDISDSDTFSRELRQAYGRPASKPVPLWLSEYTVQSDHGSATFATFVSRSAQARYLTAGFKLADALGDGVAGIGWLDLLDEPPAPASANWGLLTAALERKPAFAAMVAAPSERLRPTVASPKAVSRATARVRGVRVRITPRAGGRVTVQLRRNDRLRARIRAKGRARSTLIVRLRAALRPGRYTVSVRAARAATVWRTVRVR